MSAHKTSNPAFDATANTAEAVRQSAIVNASQAAVISAEVTYFRSVYKAAIANNVSPAVFIQALESLGAHS
jgi:hypothetical protein